MNLYLSILRERGREKKRVLLVQTEDSYCTNGIRNVQLSTASNMVDKPKKDILAFVFRGVPYTYHPPNGPIASVSYTHLTLPTIYSV